MSDDGDPDGEIGSLLEAVPAAVVVVDADGTVIAGNARAAEVLATGPESLIGRPVAELVGSAADPARERQEAHRQRLADLGRVVAAMAHEVRNPVFAIGALAQVLECEPGVVDNPDATATVRRILEEVRRVGRLVDDLLAFGRAAPIRRADVDVVALVSRTVDDFQRIQGDEHTVPLRLHVGAELASEPRWLVDADALGRILANLLRNAVQAMSGGPRPLRADEAVQVRLERRGGELELAVIDAGPGIPSEILPSVFDEFFTTRSEGTGLGLAIVSRLVEQHRGCVTFSSTPGRGTRVVVRIPP